MNHNNKCTIAILATTLAICALVGLNAAARAGDASLNLAPVTGSSTRYDFGKVDQGAVAPIKHNFLLQNDNENAVTVVRIQPSCGCTTAVVGGGTALPFTVRPGRVVEIDTSLDPLRLSPGVAEKTVAVFIEGQAQPAANLTISGTLEPAASFSPARLDFGNVAYGQQASLKLTATINSSRIASADDLQFNSSDPDVTAQETSFVSNGASDTVVYSVKVSTNSYLGLISGPVSLLARNTSGGMSIVGSPIPICGNVVGAIGASPQSVDFSNVKAGKAATRSVLLTGIAPAETGNVTVESKSPLIVAQLAAESQSVRLDITLTDKIPAGYLQTQIIVTSPKGERLMLPITAFAF